MNMASKFLTETFWGDRGGLEEEEKKAHTEH